MDNRPQLVFFPLLVGEAHRALELRVERDGPGGSVDPHRLSFSLRVQTTNLGKVEASGLLAANAVACRFQCETIEARDALADIPGMTFAFSQPIQCRIDELVAGTRAQLIMKLFGEDLDILKAKTSEKLGIVGRGEAIAAYAVDEHGYCNTMTKLDGRASRSRQIMLPNSLLNFIYEHFPILTRLLNF
jgi:hypothetical protein